MFCRRIRAVAGFVFILGASLHLASSAWATPVVAEDDTGRMVRLQAPARRIVSLAPHITENIFAAGAGEFLVGVSAYSNFPPQAQRLPIVSGFNSINIEAVLALRPDLVIAWTSGNPRDAVERIESLGLPIFRSEPRRLSDIATNIEAIGVLVGSAEPASKAARTVRERLAQLTQQYAHRRPMRAFYQVWDAPLMTVNGEHIIGDALRLCGASNVFASLPLAAPVVSIEAVIAAAPDVIVLSSETGREKDWIRAWQRFDALPAVQHGRFVSASAEAMGRHTPRLLDEVEKLCAALDRYR